MPCHITFSKSHSPETLITLQVKLTDAVPDQRQEVPPGQTTEHSARPVNNFMSMIDTNTAPRRSGNIRHGAPKLRQLLGSGVAADAVAAR